MYCHFEYTFRICVCFCHPEIGQFGMCCVCMSRKVDWISSSTKINAVIQKMWHQNAFANIALATQRHCVIDIHQIILSSDRLHWWFSVNSSVLKSIEVYQLNFGGKTTFVKLILRVSEHFCARNRIKVVWYDSVQKRKIRTTHLST